MPTAVWRSLPLLGNARIDGQHTALQGEVQQLAEDIQARRSADHLEASLALISQRTVEHFHTEEELMKAQGDPGRIHHADLHRELILQVRRIQYATAKGEPLGEGVAVFLGDWFEEHVQKVDLVHVAYLGEGEAPSH